MGDPGVVDAAIDGVVAFLDLVDPGLNLDGLPRIAAGDLAGGVQSLEFFKRRGGGGLILVVAGLDRPSLLSEVFPQGQTDSPGSSGDQDRRHGLGTPLQKVSCWFLGFSYRS